MSTTSLSSSRVVSHERVLHYVYEFLDENGYKQSLRALQEESKVPYNTIRVKADSMSSLPRSAQTTSSTRRAGAKGFPAASEQNLEGAVMEGSWAEVLHIYVNGLLLPEEIKATLYEVILEEMVELHQLVPAARSFLLNAPIFQLMKTDSPARYIRLEKLIENGQRTLSESEGMGAVATRRVTDEMRQRRTALLQQLKTAIHFAPDARVGRLAAALLRATGVSGGAPISEGSAICDAKSSTNGGGAQMSLASSSSPPTSAEVAVTAQKRRREPQLAGEGAWADTFLQYPLAAPKETRWRWPYASERAACFCLSLCRVGVPHLLIGCANGAVDFVNMDTGESLGPPLRHTDGVLSMTLDDAPGTASSPGWVAVGYRDGYVKLYNLETHKLVRRFEKAHAMGVTTLLFTGPRDMATLSGHHSLVVTGSFDGAVKVLDIAAGAVVQAVPNSHFGAFVHSLLSLEDGVAKPVESGRYCFLSSGNDGTLSVWRLQDGRCDEDESANRVQVMRVQEARPLGFLHRELQDAVPTHLFALPPVGGITGGAGVSDALVLTSQGEGVVTMDVLVLTRGGQACIASVSVKDEGSTCSASWRALCLIVTAHPLRSAFPRAHLVVSMCTPLLTLYTVDCEGTILLHNIEMSWYNAEHWAHFGGCMRLTSAADQSSALIVEVGKAVKDAHLTCIWPTTQHQPTSIVAYSPSLANVYAMQ